MRLLTKVTYSVVGVVLVLSAPVSAEESSIYFATGASAVKSNALNKLLKSAGEGASYHLTGSTDPRGSDEINRRLRESRAESVKRALMARGVDEGNIFVEEGAGSGEADPKSYWKLRRVSIRYEGGHAGAVAQAPDQGKPERGSKPDAAERKAEAERKEAERKAEIERKATERKAEAERKEAERKAEADRKAEARAEAKTDAERKRLEAQEAKAEAERKRAEAAEAKRNETDPKRKPDDPKTVAMVTPQNKQPDPPTGDSTGKHTDKKLEPLRLIYWRSVNHALWIVAKEKGFFEEEGFDVKLEETDEDARVIAKKVNPDLAKSTKGVTSDEALLAGQKRFSAGAVCGYATHEAMARGDQIVDIGSMIMMPEILLMRKELATELDNNIKAFKGKKMGELYVASRTKNEFRYSNLLRSYLDRAGLKENTDFSIAAYNDPTSVLTDLVTQKIQIAKVFPPIDVDFLKTHPEFERVPFAKIFPYLPCCRQVVTRSQLKENRQKYVRMLRASIRAHKFVIEHPIEAAAIIGKALGIPASSIRASIMSSYVSLTPDPMRKGVELYQRANDKFTNTKTATAEYVDTSLYRDALLGLAKESDDARSQGYYSTMISRFRANN